MKIPRVMSTLHPDNDQVQFLWGVWICQGTMRSMVWILRILTVI